MLCRITHAYYLPRLTPVRVLPWLLYYLDSLSIHSSFISYATILVRPDDPGTDRGSLCFRACSSVLLVHPKGGRSGGTRVVTSYTSMVLGYAGSFGYDRAPRCDWGRRQVVTALSVWRNSCVAFSVFPDVRVQCRSSCKEVTGLDVL